jgi:hypothetical protein
MVDIVRANEFTFTPSAFIAAYIEQEEKNSITETTGAGGSLVINPNQVSNLDSTSTGIGALQTTTGPLGFVKDAATSFTNPMSISGQEILGQTTTDTRTTTKTTTTTNNVTNTVVLVLSYGTFRARCADAQDTVVKIYQEVDAYLSSL